MKTLPTALILALSTAASTGCAHYSNIDLVEDPCWEGGETVVSSKEARDGTHHVIVERTRATDGPCDDTWREELLYDRRGHLEARVLDRVRCGVVEHRWAAHLDGATQTWFVEQAIDNNHDDQHDEVVSYEVAASEVDMDRLGLAAACPVMARLPVDVPAGAALVQLTP